MKRSNALFRWISWLLVIACLVPYVPVGLAAQDQEPDIDTVTVTYIDPACADVMDEESLQQVFVDMPAVEVLASDDAVEYDEAVALMRDALVARTSTFVVAVMIDEYLQGDAAVNLAKEVYYDAVEHTGDPDEGDYIRFNGCGWRGTVGGTFKDGRYCYQMTYNITYYSTAAQEAAVNNEVERILNQLDLDSASDYEKVCGIYDYICDTVTYDYDTLNDESYKLKYTAYAAFIDKTAVCQGYALMFYRLALELGVDARLITGYGNGGRHGWNIVEIGGQYYNVDSTWDAGVYNYRYFLRCTANFSGHSRDDDYEDVEFHALYPTSTRDYSAALDPADGLVASGTCGDNLSWTLRTDNILRITGTGAMYDYTQGKAPWKDQAYRIQGIHLPNGITSIGSYAFYGCNALATARIPSSVKSLGVGAFSGCRYMYDVRFDGMAPTIGSSCFENVNATVGYYDNCGWNDSNMLPYGGVLTWVMKTGYTVQFQNWNGDVIATWTGGLGETVIEPQPPTRPADNTYTYKFKGWDKPVVPCAGNAVYIAEYTAEYINYTVTFLNADGSLISANSYHYGQMVEVPAAPKVPAAMDSSLIFQGWDKTVGPCTGNATYTAVFDTAVIGDYTGDGAVTDADVIYLLWYTVFPEDYPISGHADFDHDGSVTDADVIYLLWHTVFAEDYPLT